MKTIIKKSALVVFILVTLIGYANEKNTSIKKFDARRVKIEFKDVKKEQSLKIKTQSGEVVYSQKIKKSGNFTKTFDFTELKNGIYQTELNKEYEILIKTFKVQGNLVSYDMNKEDKVYKPVIINKKNLILISKINFKKEPIDIALYYKGEIIFSETIKESGEISKRVYQLSENKKGDYKVVINANDRKFTKYFVI